MHRSLARRKHPGALDSIVTKQAKPIKVIPREDAVFRMDKNGKWRQMDDGGEFLHRKIIQHFHSSIKKDEEGFFLEQEHPYFIEKVYFPYEDTPLFVFRILREDGLVLRLNTGSKIPLDPENIFIENDTLYARQGEDRIKFSENALLSLTDYLEDTDGELTLQIDGKRHIISDVKPAGSCG